MTGQRQQGLQPRFFLMTPDAGDGAKLAACLVAGLEVSAIACLVIAARQNSAQTRCLAKTLIGTAHDHDVAVLIGDDAALATALGADGVHLTDGADRVKAVRAQIGKPEFIVGADVGGSRHVAMLAAEAGADYVGFRQERGMIVENEENLIEWWSQLFEIPCVDLNPAGAGEWPGRLAKGVDFVRISGQFWASPEHSARVMRDLAATVEKLSI